MKTKSFFLTLVGILAVTAIVLQSCKKDEQETNQKPTCKITSPTNGQEISKGDTVTISVDAEDKDGSIAEVRFFIDGVGKSASTSFPYTYNWNTENETLGNHTIKATSLDNCGESTSDDISVTIVSSGGGGGGTNTFTDPRDDQVYNTVTISNQTWMAENLKYLPSVSPSSNGSNNAPYYYVYDYEGTNVSEAKATENYQTYGVLYNWPAALNACPAGWHLPSDDEWKILEMALGMSQIEADSYGDRGTDEGKKMKSISGWNNNGNGTNSSGFTALPGGNCFGSGLFGYLGDLCDLWSSSEDSAADVWVRDLGYYGDQVGRYTSYSKAYGFSVRCLKNTTNGNTPTADFTATPTTGTAPLTVNFTDQSTNTPTSWQWDFGNGGISTQQNPSHSYNNAGNYTVTLTVTNNYGSDTKTKTGYISVTSGGGDTGTFTDPRDGQTYATVEIGTQTWFAENLKYLPSVSPPWEFGYQFYYYVYGYEGNNVSEAKATDNFQTYGVLYNFLSAFSACPAGWHLPSNDEWTVLTDYLGGEDIAGGKMKETGAIHWTSPNTGATNESGFSAFPGGERNDYDFNYLGTCGHWWSATERSFYEAWTRGLRYDDAEVSGPFFYKYYGFSVRCVRDN